MIEASITKVDTSISVHHERVGPSNSNCKNDVATHDEPCKHMFSSLINLMFINLSVITNYIDLFFNVTQYFWISIQKAISHCLKKIHYKLDLDLRKQSEFKLITKAIYSNNRSERLQNMVLKLQGFVRGVVREADTHSIQLDRKSKVEHFLLDFSMGFSHFLSNFLSDLPFPILMWNWEWVFLRKIAPTSISL